MGQPLDKGVALSLFLALSHIKRVGTKLRDAFVKHVNEHYVGRFEQNEPQQVSARSKSSMLIDGICLHGAGGENVKTISGHIVT